MCLTPSHLQLSTAYWEKLLRLLELLTCHMCSDYNRLWTLVSNSLQTGQQLSSTILSLHFRNQFLFNYIQTLQSGLSYTILQHVFLNIKLPIMQLSQKRCKYGSKLLDSRDLLIALSQNLLLYQIYKVWTQLSLNFHFHFILFSFLIF